jgi:predicted dehydrogenase
VLHRILRRLFEVSPGYLQAMILRNDPAITDPLADDMHRKRFAKFRLQGCAQIVRQSRPRGPRPKARLVSPCVSNPEEAKHVAKSSLIPNIVASPTDVIGQVDAVIIPTDKGGEHVARARPFIEAGLPVFIDKPMVDQLDDLRQFVRWNAQGKPFMSSSCMRYAKEFADLRGRLSEVGEVRIISMSMCKSWERYGIHAMEGVYPFLPVGGWESVINTGTINSNIVHAHHKCGVDVSIYNVADMYGAFGAMNIYGTKGMLSTKFTDSFNAFKTQLVDFITYLRTGQRPFEFPQTVELMKIIIAGIQSREQGGRRIVLSELAV